METTQIEAWAILNEDGEYVVSHDPRSIDDEYDGLVDDCSRTKATRVFKITITVPLPQAVELTGTVPAESTEGITLNVQ